MRAPASIFEHPVHPIPIAFPIGLWIVSLACDLIHLAGAPGGDLTGINPLTNFPILLSIIGVALIFVTGWLDGQMVHVYGVGVEGREYGNRRSLITRRDRDRAQNVKSHSRRRVVTANCIGRKLT